jgi:hypothetical protein
MSGPPSIGHEVYGGAAILTFLCAGVGELLARVIGMPSSTGLWLGGIVGATISYQLIQKAKRQTYESWEKEIRRSERSKRRERQPVTATVPISSELALKSAPATEAEETDEDSEVEARTVGVLERQVVMAQLRRLHEHHGASKLDSQATLVTVDPARSLLFIGPGEGASFETAELRLRGNGPGATWLTSVGELYRHLFAVDGECVAFGEAADGSLAITEAPCHQYGNPRGKGGSARSSRAQTAEVAAPVRQRKIRKAPS